MDGGAEWSQQPHLILSHKLFLLTHPDVQDMEKVQPKSDVLDSIKSDGKVSSFFLIDSHRV